MFPANNLARSFMDRIKKSRTPNYGERVVEWIEFSGRVCGDIFGSLAWILSPAGLLVDGIPYVYQLIVGPEDTSQVPNSTKYKLLGMLESALRKTWQFSTGLLRQSFVAAGVGLGVLIGAVPAVFLAFTKEGIVAQLRKKYTGNGLEPVEKLHDLIFSFSAKEQLFFGRLYKEHRGKGLLLGVFLAISGIGLGFLAIKAALFLVRSWTVASLGLGATLLFRFARNLVISRLQGEGEETAQAAVEADLDQAVKLSAQVVTHVPQHAFNAYRQAQQLAAANESHSAPAVELSTLVPQVTSKK